MKINSQPGDYLFKALINMGSGWSVSEYFFFSREAAVKYSKTAIWPIEILDNGTIYIPSDSELNEGN